MYAHSGAGAQSKNFMKRFYCKDHRNVEHTKNTLRTH